MNELYELALDHTLASAPAAKDADQFELVFANRLPAPVNVARASEGGHLSALPDAVPPGEDSKPISDGRVGQKYVVTTAHTGAFVTAIEISEDAEATETTSRKLFIKPEQLIPPNEMNRYPEPDKVQIIPRDSDRFLVGVGRIGDTIVLREQFWRRGNDSYMLAPNEKRTVSVTHTSGRDETSSDVETTSKSISANASASWGAVSASVSAALSKSSTSMHQVTVRTEETRYESVELHNEEKRPVMFLTWQLVDIVTIFAKADAKVPAAVIEQIQRPVLISGPYHIGDLPDPPPLNRSRSANGSRGGNRRK